MDEMSTASQHPLARRTLAASAVLACLLLTACATQTAGLNAPQAGNAQVPGQFQYAAAPAGTARAVALDEAWWKGFNDPVLSDLIDRALARNTDLAVAALRVRQAQLQLQQSESDRLPRFSGNVNANASRRVGESQPTTRSASASVGASWELDLWGRLSAQRDAAQWEAAATEEDRRAVALSLVGTTATLYWQLAYLEQQVDTAEQSLAYARKTLDLVLAQRQAGSVSGLEEAQARQSVLAQEASLSQLVQQRVVVRQSLALLLDEPSQNADAVLPKPQWPATPWPELSPGLPAEVLSRRPDLRAAEARLRGSFANVDVTRASYYPTFTLNGSVGGSSQSLSNVLANPVGTLGAALALPFLNWGTMQRNVAISQAQADAAVLDFRKTLYQALADVDTALSAQTQLQRQAQSQNDRLVQARKVEQLTELRYRSGADPLKIWLDAQESRRQAELAAAQVRYNQLDNWVALVQALGGGTMPPAEKAPS
ncbi:efflux transporter outer membrane subunit [Aquabacterium sp.]|uniref:efflux transporter outer membrane subunit n=1 Tax=Aquabacterium sp. TaxID=1872578 RepID=UPI003BAFF0B2